MSFAPEVATLDNGLTLVTDAMTSVETVSVGLWVGVGTRSEAPDVNGCAHLLEHMVFKGTERRSAQAIAEEIEAVGGHMNAYTSRENTAYYAKVLKEDLPLALDIVGDILMNPSLDPGELERERGVVLQEIGQANDTPDDMIFDVFQEVAFPDQGLGRPILGRPENVRRLGRDRLDGYRRANYAADRMVLSASGRLEQGELIRLAEALFGGMGPGAGGPPEPASYTGGEARLDRSLEQVHLILGAAGISYHHDDFFALSVLSTLVGGGMSSRLFQEVREKRGLVYSVYSFTSAYADGGLFGIYAGTGEEEVAELVPLLCECLTDVAGGGLREEEVARARAQLRASVLMSLESTSARAEQAAQQTLIYGRPLTTGEMIERIDAVDRPAVERVARHLLGRRPSLAAVGPIGRLEPFERICRRLGAPEAG
jgi:predicted Zn-dependent peptidase